MTDYERHQRKILGFQGPWDNYVTPTGPRNKDNHKKTNGWDRNPTATFDWKKVAHEERIKNHADAQNQD